jgi:hypothetical protein
MAAATSTSATTSLRFHIRHDKDAHAQQRHP